MLHTSGVKNHVIYSAMHLTSRGSRINTKSAHWTLIIWYHHSYIYI